MPSRTSKLIQAAQWNRRKRLLEKAEILFKEMGLEHNLDELQRVKIETIAL